MMEIRLKMRFDMKIKVRLGISRKIYVEGRTRLYSIELEYQIKFLI